MPVLRRRNSGRCHKVPFLRRVFKKRALVEELPGRLFADYNTIGVFHIFIFLSEFFTVQIHCL